MKLLLPFALAFLSYPALAIDGGHLVAETEALMPALVQVIVYDEVSKAGFNCTGTLIAPDLVVSAAHCLFSDVDAFTEKKENGGFNLPTTHYFVFRGNMEKGWMKDKSVVSALGVGPGWLPVKSVHIPPMFGHTFGAHYDADVSLLQVDATHAEVETGTVPVLKSLAPFRFEQPVRVIGAGPVDEQEGKDFVHYFRAMAAFMVGDLDSASHKTQNVIYVDDQGESSDCTSKYIGLDHGDSGGPALVTVDGKEFIWGVDSQGQTYTALPLMLDWLNEVATEVGSSARF